MTDLPVGLVDELDHDVPDVELDRVLPWHLEAESGSRVLASDLATPATNDHGLALVLGLGNAEDQREHEYSPYETGHNQCDRRPVGVRPIIVLIIEVVTRAALVTNDCAYDLSLVLRHLQPPARV